MEIIRKAQPPATETLSVRVAAGLKKEHSRARDVAQRQGIDMTAMVSNALSDVFKAITQTQTSGKVTPITQS
jgi:hypothetical protein